MTSLGIDQFLAAEQALPEVVSLALRHDQLHEPLRPWTLYRVTNCAEFCWHLNAGWTGIDPEAALMEDLVPWPAHLYGDRQVYTPQPL